MPKLFLDSNDVPATSKTMEAVDDYIESDNDSELIFGKLLKDGTLFLTIGGSGGTHKVQIKFHNGISWMKYHDAKDDELTEIFDSDDNIEINLRLQEFWKETIGGVKVKITRESGSGDVPITNANLSLRF